MALTTGVSDIQIMFTLDQTGDQGFSFNYATALRCSSTSRPPTLRHRPRRTRSAELAQEAESVDNFIQSEI
jgi:hypothetical protein